MKHERGSILVILALLYLILSIGYSAAQGQATVPSGMKGIERVVLAKTGKGEAIGDTIGNIVLVGGK